MSVGDQEQLLFGVLAVQLGFVSPNEVMGAAAGWMADRGRDLPTRLQAEGLLNEKQVGMLEAMLREAVRVHGGNVSKTLGALGGDGVVLQSFSGSMVMDSDGQVSLVPGDTVESVEPGAGKETVTPEQPGRYAVGKEFGRGGQARVLLAVDTHLGREVAWKELLYDSPGQSQGGSQSLSTRARFLREARITGQLEHPNIVPVHELGVRADGSHYYTMRLVRGRSLEEALKACEGLADRLRLLEAFVAVCHAVAFAHSRGVVHRDLKPANVMVGEFGETVLLDWGLAKSRDTEDIRGKDLAHQAKWLVEGDGNQTLEGAAMGTPSYMSPEQAEGDVGAIDERSDIWGLGAILYEILSDRPPFLGETPFEVVGKVMKESVEPIGGHCPEAPAELVAVAEKALRRDPAQRYPSAAELAEDISSYLTGGRVGVYAYSSWELLRRFASKNKAVVVASILVVLVIVAALIKTQLAYQQEMQARASETQARLAEKRESQLASYHLAQAYAEKADRCMEQSRFDSGRLFAVASLLNNPAYPKSEQYDEEFARRHPTSQDLSVSAASRIYRSQHSLSVALEHSFQTSDQIRQLAYSPDGGRLAAVGHDGMVTIWNMQKGEPEQRWRAHETSAFSLAFLGQQKLVTGGGSGEIKLWDLSGPKELQSFVGHDGKVMGLAVSPDGRLLASGAVDKTARIWNLRTGHCERVLKGHRSRVRSVAFSPDGKTLATGSWDKTLRLWRVRDGKLIHSIGNHDDAIYAVKFSPDGRILATACYDSRIRLFNPLSGEQKRLLEGHKDAVYDLDFSPDGRLLSAAGADRSFRLFDVLSGKLVYSQEGHRDALISLRMAPDGEHIATAGMDRMVKVWRLKSERLMRTLEGHSDWVYAVQHGPAGRRMFSAGWDRRAILWDLAKHKPMHVFGGLREGCLAAAFSPKGDKVAAGDVGGWLYVWDAASGEKLHDFRAHSRWIDQLRFSPDGKRVITASHEHKVRIFDVESERPALTLQGHGDAVQGVAFSLDGRMVATASRDKTVRLWNANGGEELRVLKGHSDWVSGVSFSPDGKLLATSGKDRVIIIWDLSTGLPIKKLRHHRQSVNRVTFSPDGKFLASVGEDRMVLIWSVALGEMLLELQAASGALAVDFSPDGKHLVVGDYKSLKIYPLDFDMNSIEPRKIMRETQAAIGQELEGFRLRMK